MCHLPGEQACFGFLDDVSFAPMGQPSKTELELKTLQKLIAKAERVSAWDTFLFTVSVVATVLVNTVAFIRKPQSMPILLWIAFFLLVFTAYTTVASFIRRRAAASAPLKRELSTIYIAALEPCLVGSPDGSSQVQGSYER